VKLRTALFLGVTLLVAGVVAAALVALSRTVAVAARDDLDRALARAADQVRPVQEAWVQRLATESRVTTTQPRLLALMSTDAITIQEDADEFRRTLDAAVLLITDPDGRVLGQAAADGRPLPAVDVGLVTAALDRGGADAVWLSGAFAYQIHVEPLVQGQAILGALVVGHTIDRRIAGSFEQLLGEPVVIHTGRRVIAASPDAVAGATAEAAVATAGGELAVGRTRWKVARAPWPSGQLEVAVLGDLGRALEPAQRLTRLLYLVGGAALCAALILAFGLGAALSRPVERLVGLTRRFAAGDLAARTPERGVTELRELAGSMNRMAGELDAGRATLVDKQRLEGELQIAQRIQTSILPRRFDVPGLEIAARMDAASEVGGDYYDVLPVAGGAWIGIGDVAGHGLDAGLVMLMAQTAVTAAVDARPDAEPRELVAAINRVIWSNTRRIGDERHMTMTLLRYHADGRLRFAGAHLDLLVVRGGAVEAVPTRGTWLGVIPDVTGHTVDDELRLGLGDLLVLYSDGVTEAMDAAGRQFGHERLEAVVAGAAAGSPADVVAAVAAAVASHRARELDDVTVVALRYRGGA